MYARIVGHVPAPVEDVFACAADPRLLERWHHLVVEAHSGGRLSHEGATLNAALQVGRDRIHTRWTVRRRVRWTLHLRSEDTAGRAAQMRLSFSPWDGGCAVELGFSCEDGYARLRGSRIQEALIRRRLRRSLSELSRLVTVGGQAAAAAHGEADLPRPAVALAPLPGGR